MIVWLGEQVAANQMENGRKGLVEGFSVSRVRTTSQHDPKAFCERFLSPRRGILIVIGELACCLFGHLFRVRCVSIPKCRARGPKTVCAPRGHVISMTHLVT